MSKQCTYCNKFGHTVDQCYSKHGYPPGSKPRENSSVHNFVIPEEAQHNTADFNSFRQGAHKEGSISSQGIQFAPEQLQQIITALQHSSLRPPHSSVRLIQTLVVSHPPNSRTIFQVTPPPTWLLEFLIVELLIMSLMIIPSMFPFTILNLLLLTFQMALLFLQNTVAVLDFLRTFGYTMFYISLNSLLT